MCHTGVTRRGDGFWPERAFQARSCEKLRCFRQCQHGLHPRASCDWYADTIRPQPMHWRAGAPLKLTPFCTGTFWSYLVGEGVNAIMQRSDLTLPLINVQASVLLANTTVRIAAQISRDKNFDRLIYIPASSSSLTKDLSWRAIGLHYQLLDPKLLLLRTAPGAFSHPTILVGSLHIIRWS